METHDQTIAEAEIRRLYPNASLRETDRAFRFSQRVRGDERVSVVHSRLSSWATMKVHRERTLTIGHLVQGRYRATTNGVQIDPGAPFLLCPGEGESWSEGLGLMMMNLDERALQRIGAAKAGVDDVSLLYQGTAPLTPALGKYWTRTVQYALSVVSDDQLLANPLVREAAFESVHLAALAAFPIHVVQQARSIGLGTGERPAAVNRAVRYIEDHADAVVTVGDIAVASRLSIRALQSAFSRHFGMTPMAYLRRVRLDAVRRELIEADPSAGVTVGVVALRWGFGHPGRFATHYLAEYGESPSRTLGR